MDKILVLDFGGQYDQLIARRIRAEHVFAEIIRCEKTDCDTIRKTGYRGIVFTGGPNSVYDPASPHFDPAVLELGIPVLGICYGHQLMAYMAGGKVAPAENGSEYGRTALWCEENILFENVRREARRPRLRNARQARPHRNRRATSEGPSVRPDAREQRGRRLRRHLPRPRQGHLRHRRGLAPDRVRHRRRRGRREGRPAPVASSSASRSCTARSTSLARPAAKPRPPRSPSSPAPPRSSARSG